VELSGEALGAFFETVIPHLDERQRRVVAGAMAALRDEVGGVTAGAFV